MVSAIRPCCIMRQIIFVLFSCLVLVGFAQVEQRTLAPITVYDTAHTMAYYDLDYRKDSTKNIYRKGRTILQISENYLAFSDYYTLLIDSLNDYAVRHKELEQEISEQIGKAIKRIEYREPLLTNLLKGATTFQMGIWVKLEYTTPTPQIAWQLMSGDTLVNGVACKKAMGRYSGRTYVAWYAESIQLPYGPYIFGGLPGLIMCIYDTKRNWIFTNSGVGPATSLATMYLYADKNREKMDRKKALDSYRNERENPVRVATGRGLLFGATPEMMKSVPSNLLEQEW